MRAILLRELGGPEVLKLETVADPVAGPGEVVVRLHAAALNHRDVWIRKGQYASIKLPVILGSDGAGEVIAVGRDSDDFLMNQHVVINPALDWGDDPRFFGPNFRILGMPDDGTYAELVKVPATAVHTMPAGWSFEEAAALPLAALTAYRAVISRAAVQTGETVIVTGIGGGVSQFALQIARARGARVFVTSRNEDKLAKAHQLGAAGGVDTQSDNWIKRLIDLTDGGADAVIDSVGGAMLNAAIELCKPGGRIVTYGATTGPTPQLDIRRVFWKQLHILGSTMGTPHEFSALLDLYRTFGLKPNIDQVFAFADAAGAHRCMEDAGQFGKIVLNIA